MCIKTENLNKALSSGLSALQLKCMAFFCMLIDHMAWAVPFFRAPENEELYLFMRGIGRMAFPIFCFFIAEGAVKTKHKTRYLLRVLLLAFACEIPFNSFKSGHALYVSAQNTAWTLFLGLLGILAVRKILEARTRVVCEDKRCSVPVMLWTVFLSVCSLLPSLLLAHFLRTDYGWRGVFLIYAFFAEHTILRRVRWRYVVLAALMAILWLKSPLQLLAILALLPLSSYNGKPGRKVPRYTFYVGYFAQECLFAGIVLLCGVS